MELGCHAAAMCLVEWSPKLFIKISVRENYRNIVTA